MRESSSGILRTRLRAKTTPQTMKMPMASFWLNWSMATCSGVLRRFVAFMSPAILPSSVSIPVAVTMTLARP